MVLWQSAIDKNDTQLREAPMKLGKGISWLMGNPQRSLFPQLEECWGTTLTEKQQLASILELVQIEKYVPWSALNQ
jgi:hypothetical protein